MSASQALSPKSSWTRWIGTAAAVVLGGVLLFSAFAKAIDIPLFADSLRRFGFIPLSMTTVLAYAVVAFEAVLGVILVTNFRTKPVLLLTSATFVFFTLVVARELLLPESERTGNCGCFGSLVERTPQQALIEDLIFVALSGLAWLGRTESISRFRRRLRTIFAGLAGVASVGLTAIAPSLPFDDLATRLKVGATAADTKLDTVITELQEGRVLLVIFDRDRDDEATKVAVQRLNDELFFQENAATQLFGLATNQPELAAKFLWTMGPAFEFREAPPEFVRGFYRKLPRAALFDGGKIVRVWNEIPSREVLQSLARGELE